MASAAAWGKKIEFLQHVFFQGLWYHDVLVRTPAGWRISERVERDYYVHNLPEGFRFQD